ncbi:DSD1 family PLP-dependent enzyme [Pseudomaricurvus alkylphenolicus]|uniref:alanine racemase n=1 Tax=Pseudomaricurvus alkylphenolicus TaxID=1306991 RepID=UPI0014242971|nr:DSD1 family PLP-dependent enzyme [Pseudomaricurvus alkylphenolicus]
MKTFPSLITRRQLIKAATVATAADAAGSVLTSTAGVARSAHSPYFKSLQGALDRAGLHRPTLVIDKDRFVENIRTLRTHWSNDIHYRAVTKSLPAYGLIETILEQTQSQRLMVFHQPFLNSVAKRWPEVNCLLGKPMPVGAVDQFYRSHQPSAFDPARQVQWLVDSMPRLIQYRDFAESRKLNLSINLEIDVGFHRGGFSSPAEMRQALLLIQKSPGLNFSGFMGYDGHISIFPQFVGQPEKSLPETDRRYRAFVEAARKSLDSQWDEQAMTLNTGGSTTYQLYRRGREVTVANDIAVGSGLIKPRFCDATLGDHQEAVFIATPVLKTSPSVDIPGHAPETGKRMTLFTYGGKWMAEVASPQGLENHPVYGRSSNQDMFTAPLGTPIFMDDRVFLRPSQTEGVLLQFGDIAVYQQGEIREFWPTLQTS